MPIASLISPVFLRERTDKLPDLGSIGLDQIFARLPFESRFDKACLAEKTASKVVKRGVFTKVTKDQMAVRKYVAVETNKADDPAYPPYVVYFTDYSAGRAEPLKTSLRVAASPTRVDALIQAWLEENVKRGWNEAGAPPAPAAPAAPKVTKKAKAAAAEPAVSAEPVAAPSPEAAAPDAATPAPAEATSEAAPAKPSRKRKPKADTAAEPAAAEGTTDAPASTPKKRTRKTSA